MKRILTKVLAVALCAAMLGGSAAALTSVLPDSSITASAETYGDFEYFVGDDDTGDDDAIIITEYIGSDAKVTIPSKIEGKK